MKKNTKIKAFFFYTIAIAIVSVWLIPFFITLLTSWKPMDEIMSTKEWLSFPKNFTWENYVESWTTGNMQTYFYNTFVITVPSVLGALFLSSLSGFALSYYKFKMGKIFLMIFISGMLIPFQMLLIPVFRLSKTLGIYNSYFGVIFFHIAFQIGFCTFFIRNFMITIPKSLFESARIDGAKDIVIYLKLALPLSLPALAALGILEFTWIWNDYLWSLVLLQSDRLKTISLGLVSFQGQYVSSWNLIASASLITAIVPLLVFLIFQRYFIEGLTVGAVKG